MGQLIVSEMVSLDGVMQAPGGAEEDTEGGFKQKHGEVHVIGSGNLVQTLLRFDLVDRLSLWVYPLLLGTGKRLFGEGTLPAGLRLTSSAAFPKGAIHLAYERAGKPTSDPSTQSLRSSVRVGAG